MNIAKTNQGAVTAEQVLIRGDLAALDEAGRINYYNAVCQSVGLNPLTKPFEYITLNGRLRLYALKDCTDQLRAIHGVSVTEMAESERDGVFIVTVKVVDKNGRADIAKGAVNIGNLKGETLANALMKAETKAKRRATLSICGLGMLDETEVDDIPPAAKSIPKVPAPPPAIPVPPPPAPAPKNNPFAPVELPPDPGESIGTWCGRFITQLNHASNLKELAAWTDLNRAYLDIASKKSKKTYAIVEAAIEEKKKALDPISTGVTSHPDIEQDYEGWLEWAHDSVKAAGSDQFLTAFCQREIDPHERTLFPPDYQDLIDAIGRRQKEFAKES